MATMWTDFQVGRQLQEIQSLCNRGLYKQALDIGLRAYHEARPLGVTNPLFAANTDCLAGIYQATCKYAESGAVIPEYPYATK